MITVHKYQLAANACVEMPIGAKLLTVQMQKGVPVLWALVDTDAEMGSRFFFLCGTGWVVPKEFVGHLEYVNTVQADNGMVWHVFENHYYDD